MPLPTSHSLDSSSLRPVSKARISCAGAALACTDRNQPMRISCAMPRASFRSVFTVIAFGAALTCRVSIKIAVSPASTRPACSHCDSGPASSPIRANDEPLSRKNVISASGSLATFVSRTIRPVASTTHTLLSSKDTSIAAKCSTAVPLQCLGPTQLGPRSHHHCEAQPPHQKLVLPRCGPITASRDTTEAYRRARELCEELGESVRLLPVLYGEWAGHYVRA